LTRTYRAGVNAFPATLAQLQIADDLLIQTQSAIGTCANAITAAEAGFIKVDKLWFGGLTFGIVTPPAAQGTTLEKYRRPNPWPIVQRKTHDVKDKPGRFRCT
jgi:hypothetical protein